MPLLLEGQKFEAKESKKRMTGKVYDITAAVLKNIETLSLDYLIAIGDDTLSYASEFDRNGIKMLAGDDGQ